MIQHAAGATDHVVQRCLDELRAGRPVIVVDDESREDEADLVLAAQFAEVDQVAFFLEHTSGFLCVATTQERLAGLELPQMVDDPTDPLGTAFTVSVDAATGVGTGISAADRAHTIRLLGDRTTRPADLTRPGHVMPLAARRGGVAQRRGHTEAAVDLCIDAGLEPAGLICELVSEDRRTMLARGDVQEFADRHGLAVISIADLAAYRENTAQITRGARCRLPTDHGEFEAIAYRTRDGVEHLALVHGDVSSGDPLIRVHSECLTGDTLGSRRCDCGHQLRSAMERITVEGRGVVVYLGGHEGRGIGLSAKIAAYRLQDLDELDTVDANLRLGLPVDGRDYDAAAAILSDLGCTRIRLLTNNPAKPAALSKAGVQVAEIVELATVPTVENLGYLAAKRDRLGHCIPQTMRTTR